MDDLENSLKKITKGAALIFLGLIISKILGYVYRILIARTGTEIYGLMSIGIAVFSLMTAISLLGLDRGLLRYVSFYKGKEDLEKANEVISFSFKITFFISILISIIFFIFSKQISLYFFHNQDLSIVFKILAVFIPFSVFRELISNIFQAFQKIKYEIYSKNIIENITKIILTIIFMIMGIKLIGFTIAYAFGILISSLTAFFFFKKKIFPSFKANLSISSSLKKELFVYSLPLTLSILITSIMNWTDTLMLGYFKTTSEVGIYNAALPTASFLYIVPSMLLTLFVPILTELYVREKKDIFEQIYKRVIKWIFLTNTILLGILYLFSKPILKILFGNEYVPASTALIILSMGYFVGFLMTPSTRVLMVIKRTKLIFINTLIIMIVNITLNFYLIPIYGINGAAIATATAFLIRAILLFVESILVVKIMPFNLKYVGILFSALISLFLVKTLSSSVEVNFFYLIFFSIIFVIVYILLLIFTKSLEKEDIFILNSIKEKLINFRKD